MNFATTRGNKSSKLVFRSCKVNYVKTGSLEGMWKLLRQCWQGQLGFPKMCYVEVCQVSGPGVLTDLTQCGMH